MGEMGKVGENFEEFTLVYLGRSSKSYFLKLKQIITKINANWPFAHIFECKFSGKQKAACKFLATHRQHADAIEKSRRKLSETQERETEIKPSEISPQRK
jgi:hypothetical protein